MNRALMIAMLLLVGCGDDGEDLPPLDGVGAFTGCHFIWQSMGYTNCEAVCDRLPAEQLESIPGETCNGEAPSVDHEIYHDCDCDYVVDIDGHRGCCLGFPPAPTSLYWYECG